MTRTKAEHKADELTQRIAAELRKPTSPERDRYVTELRRKQAAAWRQIRQMREGERNG